MEDLQGVVDAIAGVASSQVDPGEADEPVVRIWLDGTRDPDQVASDVDRVLRDAGFSPRTPGGSDPSGEGPGRPPRDRPDTERVRRTGLGRGLGALIQPPEEGPGIAAPVGVAAIAVVQTAGGTAVRVTDSEGRNAEAPVDAGMSEFLAATTVAVATLLRIEDIPALRASDEREFGGARVVSVVVDAGGTALAGSAVVEAGELLAYAQAMWAALRPIS